MEPVHRLVLFVIELAIRGQILSDSPAIILEVSPSAKSLVLNSLTLYLLSNFGRLGDKSLNQPFIEPSLPGETPYVENH